MTTIRLAALNGKNGFRLDGSATQTGGAVVQGDVDGDGLADFAIYIAGVAGVSGAYFAL